jgi:multiple sugar transport system substrate-binding protein
VRAFTAAEFAVRRLFAAPRRSEVHVRFLAPDTDAYVESVQRHAAEFTERTRIDVNMKIIPSDEYFSNEIGPYLEGEDAADVYMSGPVLVWEQLAAGYVRPLDEFFDRASDRYDPDDFVERLLSVNRWDGTFGHPLGSGPLLEIPVNCESYNLAYRPSALADAGVAVPETWDDFFAAARASVARGVTRGFGQRGVDVWHTMYTGFATQLWSYGGSDFEGERCSIASDVAVEATSDFVAALRDAGPEDWLDQRWYELALDFAQGRYALIVDSDHYVAYFEDARYSDHVGEFGYALPPAGPAGRRPNLWTWSVVMNGKTSQPDLAWRFIEWATSREFLRRSVYEGNMNPTRRSIWDDEGFQAHVQPWGSFYEVARTLVERDAFVLVTPTSRYREIATRWVYALRQAYAGRAGVREALEEAALDIDAALSGERSLGSITTET